MMTFSGREQLLFEPIDSPPDRFTNTNLVNYSIEKLIFDILLQHELGVWSFKMADEFSLD